MVRAIVSGRMARTISSRSRFTPRLELRPFKRRDLDQVLAAIHDSLPELESWLPWAHAGYGRSEAMRFLRDSGSAWVEGRAFDFAIRPRHDSDHHLGNISVWPTSQRERSGEIGYWIRSDDTGAGIATEATARVTEVAFGELRLHRVTLRIAVGNRSSERVAEKLGYVREGLLREEVLVHGTWMDHTLWAMLEDEYDKRRPGYVEMGWLEGS
jgi:ribosomal-protein-serine acetyltransferase